MGLAYSNLYDGTESGCISISSLMSVGLVAKSVAVAEVCFFVSFCMTVSILLAGTAS